MKEAANNGRKALNYNNYHVFLGGVYLRFKHSVYFENFLKIILLIYIDRKYLLVKELILSNEEQR